MAELAGFLDSPVVITSPEMQLVLERAKRLASLQSAVLITGEAGTGKAVVARALHEYSERRGRAWVDVNCRSIPARCAEGELFGEEDYWPREGLFELANRGTLFLDEVAELDLAMQARLVAVLDGAPYVRLGGSRWIAVDVRVVAATNEDLASKVRQGSFRADLYHRLARLQLPVPPLRERRGAILPLARFFLARQGYVDDLSPELEAALLEYAWPGNVRQLGQMLTRACNQRRGAALRPQDLPELWQERCSHEC